MEPLYIAGRSINLLLSGDVQFGFTGGPQTVHARANRDTVMRLLRGVVDTTRFIKTDPKRTTELLGKIYREHDQVGLMLRRQGRLSI